MIKDKDYFSRENPAEISVIPVVQGDIPLNMDEKDFPEVVPILALRGAVLFPHAIFPITVGRAKSIKLIKEAEKHGSLIGAVPQLDANVEDPGEEDLYKFGTLAKILKTIQMPDGNYTAILQGVKRLYIDSVVDF